MNIWELHPALVHFPIALLLGGVALDIYAWWRSDGHLTRVATGLLIAGIAAGLLAANFGLLAFYTVPAHTHEAHRLMFWHIGLATSSLLIFGGVAWVRWRRRNSSPPIVSRVLGMAAAALLTGAGYLGGYIVYHGGAGVDPELLVSAVREAHSHGAHGKSAHSGHSHSEDQAPEKRGPGPADDQLPEGHHAPASSETDAQEKSQSHPTQVEGPKTKEPQSHHEHKGHSDSQSTSQGEVHQTDKAVEHEDHGEKGKERKTPKKQPKTDEDTEHGSHSPDETQQVFLEWPDFERNVTENRQRNMPKRKDHKTPGKKEDSPEHHSHH